MKPNDIMLDLKSKGYTYKLYEHDPVYTVAEAAAIDKDIPGGNCKNMLLTNKKRTAYYLVIMQANKRMNFKTIENSLGVKHLKFAKESTLERFDTFAGSVSPFVVLEDKKEEIEVYMDEDLLQYELVNFHPNLNSMTLGMMTQEFLEYMVFWKHTVHIVTI